MEKKDPCAGVFFCKHLSFLLAKIFIMWFDIYRTIIKGYMYVSRINSFLPQKVNFGRRLTKEEEYDYKENAIKPALDYLGVKEVAMILHGTSYPKSKYDIGVGTPYGKVAAQLMPFEILHGFNSNQLGPIGELNSVVEYSPYKSSVGTKNYLFIDFSKFQEDAYGNLLSNEWDLRTLTDITKSDGKNYAYSNFPDAFTNAEFLLNKAYNKYKLEISTNRFQDVPNIYNLFKEQEKFEKAHWQDLNNAALFHVLRKHYGTDDFTKWDEVDRNLKYNSKDEKSIRRLSYLNFVYSDDMDVYKFGQFILDKQIKENADLRKEYGFKYISDMLVGFSPADEWAHQDLFLKDYRMGCPYGGNDGGIQRWNVPVLDPKKLFDSDGNLGDAGKYLKAKLEDALTNFDNVRIDHVLGLVDPFIYSKNGYRQGNIDTMPDIDPDKNYQKVLSKIILPTLEEHGIDKNSPVWEDLVTETPAFTRIYYCENGLPGITPLEYKKGEYSKDSKNWVLIGSHDSDPAHIMIKKDWVRANEAWDPRYLAGVLNAAHDSSEYCKKIDRDDNERVKAKFAELFMMGDKVQISFADFFGIDKIYNQGGNDANPNNWKLRLNKNYEDTYYENLASEHPTAINMPEVLKLALKGEAEMKIAQGAESEKVWDEVDKTISALDKYAQILKE